MLMKNRRGLSDVITTVLIILLVLAAVVLIWGFIRGGLGSGGETIDLQSQCLKLSDGLEPKLCEYRLNATAKDATVTIQWKSGDVELNMVRLVVTSGNGANNVTEIAAPTAILGSVSGVIQIDSLKEPLTASVAGKIKTKTGTEGYCPEASVKIACANVTGVK